MSIVLFENPLMQSKRITAPPNPVASQSSKYIYLHLDPAILILDQQIYIQTQSPHKEINLALSSLLLACRQSTGRSDSTHNTILDTDNQPLLLFSIGSRSHCRQKLPHIHIIRSEGVCVRKDVRKHRLDKVEQCRVG